ncbi:hypothetical protein PARSHIK_4 [Erwinia phage vB_EamM_Parshik]|nr:hypothetical protein PARSHIK_4 [Erwinia phage vB_EamM_Parshik]
MAKQKINIVEGRDGVKYAERNGVVCRLDMPTPKAKKEFSQQECEKPRKTK